MKEVAKGLLYIALTRVLYPCLERLPPSTFSGRTWHLLHFEFMRLRARAHCIFSEAPEGKRLHFGCGEVHVDEWLNVDVQGSDYDLDLASGTLPWESNTFEVVASQHLVEHLELHDELIPLLKELNRTMQRGAEIWLCCPDLEKICRSYFDHRGVDLIHDRQTRWPNFTIKGPSQHMINDYFHQYGEHKNLYDFELLKYALESAGFVNSTRVQESDFNERFPNFPERGDNYSSLYVRAEGTQDA